MEKEQFQHKYFYRFHFSLKHVIKKMFYIGKVWRLNETLHPANKKFTEDDKILRIYFNFYITQKILLENFIAHSSWKKLTNGNFTRRYSKNTLPVNENSFFLPQ